MYDNSVNFFSKIYNLIFKDNVKPSRGLINACAYLEKGEGFCGKIVKSSILITIISCIISLSCLSCLYFTNQISFLYSLILLSLPVLINHFYSNYYKDAYYGERVKDLSLLPDFFTLLISNLKITPNLENALINTRSYDYGKITRLVKKLAADLEKGKEWDVKKRFLNIAKIFQNDSVNSAANSLISSLSIRSMDKRNELLGSSLNYLLNGLVDETKNFARSIYVPVLMLFSFGTIIPLIIISIIPLIGLFSNNSFDLKTIIILFAANLVIIKLVINNLKKKSPSKFSQIRIKKEEKGINIFLLIILFIGLSSPTIVYFFSSILPFEFKMLEGYRTIFAFIALSACIGAYYYSKSRNLMKEKAEAEKLESELIESFYLLGSRINERHSVESSLKYVSEVVSRESAKNFLEKAYHKVNNLGMSLEKAFSRTQLLSNVYSERVKSLVDLFVISVKKHSLTASENIIEVCNYYRKIQEAEKEMINSMSKNTEMIRLTNYLFTPLVCALIINIQRMINSIILTDSSAFFTLSFSVINPETVQFAISLYVLFLTLLLSELYSFLTNNNEKIESFFEKAKNVIVSCAVFTATLIISRLLLFNL